MTTAVDLGLLDQFSFILPILLVYAGTLGTLSHIKTFGPVINQIISIVAALMMLFIPSLLEVIQFAVPWMIVIVVVGLTLLGIAKFFGVSDHEVKIAFGRESLMYWFIAAFAIIIIASLTKVYFGPGNFYDEGSSIDAISESRAGDFTSGEVGFWTLIFHPAVLGFIVVMLIAVFTVGMITS